MSIKPLLKLKVAKQVAPAIFSEKTPKVHIDLHTFLNRPSKFKAICMFRGGGKTTSINKVDMFSDIFLAHERFTQIFSSTQTKAEKFIADAKTMIINAIKKGYNIKKGGIWKSNAIEVIVDNEFVIYVEVYGAGQDPRGSTYEFARPTKHIYDDIESNQGAYAIRTRANRKKLRDWFYGECIPALDPIYGRVIFIGTILHEDSLLNRILKNKRKWDILIIPIIQDGKSSWKDRFPLTDDEARTKEKQVLEATGKAVEIESIEEIKRNYKELNQLKTFYQEYLCVAQAEESKLFKEQYFKYFSHIEYSTKETYLEYENAIESKRVLVAEPLYIVFDDGTKLPIVDTVRYATKDQASSGSKTHNDNSVIITCAYDSADNMYILDISCGVWTPFDKSINIMRTFKQFQYVKLGIESGGMQNEYFYTIAEAQKAMDMKIPVEPISHNGVNKNIRIAGLEVLFLAGKIWFNRNDPNTSTLEAQLLSFDIDIESDADDLSDTLAYQRRFHTFKNHSQDEYEDDDDSTW